MKLSQEQREIIEQSYKFNICVDAIAGSGKSTLLLHMAKRYPDRTYLLLTYNAKLKLETRERIVEMGLENIECHSFHSYAVKYIDSNAYTDNRLYDTIIKDVSFKELPNYDVLILDECQDLTELYVKQVKAIYNNNKKNDAKIVIVGDYRQSIYQFNGADDKYIREPHNYFNWNSYQWKQMKLSKSFRITKPMADLINSFNKTPFITSNKNGDKPFYIITNPFNIYNKVSVIFDRYSPNDIFVLAPSVKGGRSPICTFSNELSIKGIPIYIPTNDERIDERVAQDKVIFSSFHQAKGLERPVVIIFGFETSYFRYFGRNLDKTMLPNAIYVALTRASEKLIIIQSHKDRCPKFTNNEKIRDLCNVYGTHRLKETINNINKASVTDLIKHIPISLIKDLMKRITIEKIREPSTKIRMSHIIDKEFVANINGTVIPMWFQFNVLNQSFSNFTKKTNTLLDKYIKNDTVFKEIDISNITDLTRYAVLYEACTNQQVFKVNQLKRYDWIDSQEINLCMNNLKKLNIDNNAIFEKPCFYLFMNKIQIFGSIDCVSRGNVYEFKCVDEITEGHILQLVIYKYLLENNQYKYEYEDNDFYHKNYLLYNILTDELLKITCNETDTKYVFETLAQRKL